MLQAAQLVDPAFYLAAYPDVAQAWRGGQIQSPLEHFMLRGRFEGRSPSILFDPAFYLKQNPDVAAVIAANPDLTGFDHYMGRGQLEERAPSHWFNPQKYLQTNPDVAAAINRDRLTGAPLTKDSLTSIEHFIERGILEGRAWPAI